MSEQEQQQGLTYTPLLKGVYARTKKRDGSETEPALAFAAHPGTGVYRAGTNDLGVSVDGRRVVRVDGNGMHVEGTVVVHDVVGPNGETFVTDLEHVRTDFVPSADDTWTLGNATHAWAHVHAAELETSTLNVSGELAFEHVAANVDGLIEGGLIAGGIDLSNIRNDMKPATHATYDVGASGRLWNTAWVETIVAPTEGLDIIVDDAVVGHVDDAKLTVTGNVDANIVVDGVPLEEVPLDLGAVASDVAPADGTYELGARDPARRWTDLHAATIAGNVAFAVDDQTVLAVERSNVLVYGDVVVDAATGADGAPLVATYDWEHAANLIPRDDGTIDLGETGRPWATVYSTTFDVGDGTQGGALTGNATANSVVLSVGHVTAPALRTAQRGLARPLVLRTISARDPGAEIASGVPTQVTMTGERFGPGMVLYAGNAMCETFVTRSDGTEAVATVEADEAGLLECTLVRGDTEKATATLLVVQGLEWVTEPQLPPIAKGMYYETTVVATAGERTVTYASSDLPTGLTIDSTTGVISGAVDVEVVPELSWTVTASTGPTSGNSIEREFVAAYEAPSVSIGESGMALGTRHSLVPTATGLFTFGDGTSFQLLDDRMSSNHYKPENVIAAIGDETVVAVAGGIHHTIVLTAEGGIWTAGSNYYGQLGHSENVGISPEVPTAVRDIRNEGDLAGRTIVSVTAELYGTFAVDDAGTVISWGYNGHGNLARSYNFQTGSDPVPTATSVTNIVKLSSDSHTVALTADGRVLTWGHGGYGRLGNGGTVSTWQPQTVTSSGSLSGRTVVDVAAGVYHTVVVCSDGTVHGTGRNNRGCLADSVPVGSDSLRFAQLSFPTNAVSVACGQATYVIDDAGDVWGCGANSNYGELGIPGGDKSIFTKITGSGNPQGSLFGRSDVTAVATFAGHVLVQCADGSVHAFGNNGNGQSGIDNGYVNVLDPVDITSQFALPPV